MAIKDKKMPKSLSGASKTADISESKSKGVGKKAPFAVVESYKSIRTNLTFLLAQNNGKVVAFSSSNSSEGKSTTAVNIAIAFSQLGGKILLVDADLRRSSVHKKLKLENAAGLSNVLVGLSTFEETVQHVNDSLDVITAGQIPPNPSELLGSVQFEQFVENMRERYDYVIIDTPPIGVVTDALIIAPRTDGLVMIVRDGFTPTDSLKRSIDAAQFANINILGAVMNGANPRSNRRYSYRKYGYGGKYYKYGYGSGYGYGYGYGSNSQSGGGNKK